MAEVKVLYDHIGGTLCVWWDNPQDEEVCSETDDDLILVKDKTGQVIGFEYIHFQGGDPADFRAVALTEDYLTAADAADAAVRLFYDHRRGVLRVQWGLPQDAKVGAADGYGIALSKNQKGRVIGLEKFHYSLPNPADFKVVVETFVDDPLPANAANSAAAPAR